MYPTATPAAQSQLPGRDVKMPPMGQFNVKDTNKETKKRRGGPINVNAVGGPGTGPAAETPRMGDLQSNRGGSVQAPGIVKVSVLLYQFFLDTVAKSP